MNKQDNKNSSEERNPVEEKKTFEKKNLIKLLPAAAVIGALAVTGFSGNQENIEKETKAAVQSEELESLLMTAYSYSDTDSTTSTKSTDSSKEKKKAASSKKKKKSGLSTGTTKARPSESEKTSATGQGSTSTPTTTVPEGGYADGTYTGSGTGFGGTITVSVTVSGGKITSIDILSASGETPSYFASAKGVISKIISSQSPNVDAVSGATYSSNGIISAVQNALSKAGGSGNSSSNTNKNTKKNTKTTPTPTAKPINIKKPDKNSTYKDGTYSGEAEGFSGTVKVTVTIKNGKITKVSNTNTDTKEYFDQAWKSIQPVILKKQGVYGVDTVSGATYSSNGIIGAAQNALNKALTTKKTTAAPTPTSAIKTPTPTPEVTVEPTQTPQEDDVKTYTGRARGFQGWVNITIKVKEGKIISVENTNQDTPAYFRSAWNSIQPKILEKQTAEGIDTVSGATYSSEGILDAAQIAITAAKEDGAFVVTPTPTEAPDTTAAPTPTPEATETPAPTGAPETSVTPTPTETPDSGEDSAAGYLDGTYSGTAFGYEDYVTVTVTIANGKITEIANSNADDPDYFESAWEGIYPKILEKQTAEGIDTVSGATFSSRGILEAVASALSQAKG